MRKQVMYSETFKMLVNLHIFGLTLILLKVEKAV